MSEEGRVVGKGHKLERFRANIRRETIRSRFSHERGAMLNHVDFEVLRELLGRLEKENELEQRGMREMLDIFEQHVPSAAFDLKASAERMELGLAHILQQHGSTLTLMEQASIFSTLDYLTYYCDDSSSSLMRIEDFPDYLQQVISHLKLLELDEVYLLQRIIVLLMNLSSLLRREFNLFLAEADIARSIVHKLAATHNFSEYGRCAEYTHEIDEARLLTIRLFKNIVKGIQQQDELTVPLVLVLLEDQAYFDCHPAVMLLLLGEGMRNGLFWRRLLDSDECLVVSQLHYGIGCIQHRCELPQFLKEKE
jgi:hypothetical protein